MLPTDVIAVIMSFHNPNEKIANTIKSLAQEAQDEAWKGLRSIPMDINPSKNYMVIDRLLSDVYIQFRFQYEDNDCSKMSPLYWYFHDLDLWTY